LEVRNIFSINEKSFVLGWIETEKEVPSSLFTKLAEHMGKKDIARRYAINDRTTIYFLHHSQIPAMVHENAIMVFLIVSQEIIE